jgi:hypothetical protein
MGFVWVADDDWMHVACWGTVGDPAQWSKHVFQGQRETTCAASSENNPHTRFPARAVGRRQQSADGATHA